MSVLPTSIFIFFVSPRNTIMKNEDLLIREYHNKFNKKISALRCAARALESGEFDERIGDIHSKYLLEIAPYVTEWICGDKLVRDDPIFDILVSNLLPQIHQIEEDLNEHIVMSVLHPGARAARHHLDSAKGYNLVIHAKRDDSDICSNGHPPVGMMLRPEVSELRCPKCGIIKQITGVIFREDQIFIADTNRSRHSNYEPSRHFRSWIERIQAIESHEIPSEVIDQIRDHINKTGQPKNYSQIRKILKVLHLTEYNDHAALFTKMFVGRAPPTLTIHEIRSVEVMFNKIMEAYEEIIQEDAKKKSHNKPYYPYFIYKIIENQFAGTSKMELLDFIHLQRRETIIKNDNLFKKICERLNRGGEYIRYKSTNYIE